MASRPELRAGGDRRNGRSRARRALGVVGLLLGSSLRAAPHPAHEPPPGATRLVAERWGVEDGLPQNTVNSIVQTRDGYIWVGTFDGLARFDGVRFTVFHTGNTKGLGSSRILSLLEARDGTLWISTEGGGVSRYREGGFERVACEDPALVGAVHYLHEDREGGVWLWSERGLVRFESGCLTVFAPAVSLRGSVAKVFTPGRGGVWFATSRGLARFEGGKLTVLDAGKGLPGISVSSVEVDAGGAVWIGTDKGLARLLGETLRVFSMRDGLPSDEIISILEDGAGTLWVATKGGPLARFTGTRFELVARRPPNPSGLTKVVLPALRRGGDGSLWLVADDVVHRIKDGACTSYPVPKELEGLEEWSVLGDREGNLWIGTRGSGLHRLRPALVGVLTKADGLPAEETYAILETANGDIWIGTQGGGLSRFDGRNMRTYTTRDGLPNDSVWALCEARDGDLWIGTWGGLGRMSKGRVSAVRAKDGPWGAAIVALFEDRSGSLWIGTRGRGLRRMADGGLTTYTTKDGLANDYVRTIFQDSKGNLWIATDGGVSRFAYGRFTNITTKDGLSDSFVRSIYEDGDGALWFGTYGNGLNRLKRGKLTAITTRDGLFDHTVSQILEDDQGRFWMTSNKGIYRVARKELDDFADGKTQSISCASYGKPEGMKDAECNGGCQPAGCESKDGRLWFPTAGGVVVIDPSRLSLNPVPPPVVIEAAAVDGRPLDVRAKGVLPPGASRLQVRYTGLSFVNHAKVRFRYRLDGFETSWVDAGTSREAIYTHLNPGHYRFRVLACNNDGVWSEEGASWSFELTPFFYQRPVFYVFCALAIVTVALAAHLLRLREILSRQSVLFERNRIAREIHDTVSQGLSAVALTIEAADGLLLTRPDQAKAHLSRARDLVRDSREETRRAIDALRQDALERGGLAEALGSLSEAMARGGTDVRIVFEGDARSLPAGVESDLWRIAQEAVTNAVRHGKATRIVVTLRPDPKAWRLTVSDDGVGFQPPASPRDSSPGFGLIGMRERARGRGWRWSVESGAGRGTTVSVEAPRRNRLLRWVRE